MITPHPRGVVDYENAAARRGAPWRVRAVRKGYMGMKTKFDITGMTCSACSAHVEKAVAKLNGVKKVSVNLLTNSMTAEYDESAVSAEDIVQAVEKAGYGAAVKEDTTSGTNKGVSAAVKATVKAAFDITGMTCSACSAHVEKAVAKLDGVQKVSVNLLTNSMTAEYDENAVSAEDIVQAVEKAGYGAAVKSEKTEVRKPSKSEDRGAARKKAAHDMKTRLIVSLVFMVILMYVAMGHMFGAPLPRFLTGAENAVSYAFTQLLLTLPIIYVNRAYYINGFKRLIQRAPNMDTLVAVGSVASLIYGIFVIYRMSYALGAGDITTVEGYMHDLYFESAGMILALVTVGKYLETLSKRRTGDALDKLKKLAPETALLVRDGREIEVESSSLAVGDIIAVKSGMAVPQDAVVTEGNAFVDESAISGESVPVEKSEGARLIGGTISRSGYVRARVSAVGNESVLQRIINLVEEAGADKAPIAKIADKVSGIFVPVVMAIALATFIGWAWGTGDIETALQTSVSVLVISCPCALGLATPVAIMVGTGKGAENGILIKSGEALETLHTVKYVVLDKTGTITEGRPGVTDVTTDEETLRAVYALEKKSEHPLGSAVVEYAEGRGISAPETGAFETIPGRGIKGEVAGKTYCIGNALFMRESGVDEKEYSKELERVTSEGKTPLMVAAEGKYLGLIAAIDSVKETSAEAISLIKKEGIKTVMLTGDNRRTAEAIARVAGVDEVIAEVLPEDKEQAVAVLMEKGKVAMVGDGINDAPALTRADVGIAIGSGADIAVDSADIILVKNDLMDVVNALRLSARTMRNIKENLFWAFFYNTLGIPLAAGVLYVPFGIRLNPMIGALAMSLSSLFVVGNALRLKLFKPLRPAKSLSQGTHEEHYKKSPDGCAAGACPIADTNNYKIDRRYSPMKTELNIDGMMCMHCVSRVEKALKETAGVSEVEVSLENKNAVVSGGEPEALKKAVEEAGYTVTEIKRV